MGEGTVRPSGGIQKWKNHYFSGDMPANIVGRRVQFAYSPWDTRTIEVIHNGVWVCTAKAAPPTEAERQQHAGRLGARAAEMSQRRKRVNERRREENQQLARELPAAAALSTPTPAAPTGRATRRSTSRRDNPLPRPVPTAQSEDADADAELFDLSALRLNGEEAAS
jgi:hypothetical protein